MPSEPTTCQLTFKILKPTKRQRWTDALKVPTKFGKVLEHLRHIVTMPSWTPAPFDSLNAKTQDSTEEIPTTNVRRIIDCDDDVNILDDSVLGHRQVLDRNCQTNPHQLEHYPFFHKPAESSRNSAPVPTPSRNLLPRGKLWANLPPAKLHAVAVTPAL
ncbi:hypothetical protein FRC04_005071 [Tulasnella sp. 424]|nr:hypothetical protein FRC04_005071 [Tulasnella sp. 424]